MDRLTTGRRHVRAGSVHVTELINKTELTNKTESTNKTEPTNKQALRTGVPAPPANSAVVTKLRPEPTRRHGVGPEFGRDLVTAAEAPGPVGEYPTSHRRPPSRGAQLAKLTGLGAATLVLCGAVAAATMISHQRPDQDTSTRLAPRITGGQALLPDQLDRTLPSAGGQTPPPPAAPPEVERPAPPSSPSSPSPAPATPPDTVDDEAAVTRERAGTASPASPPVAVPASHVALVKKFYGLLPSDPDSAFGLIAPNLLSTTPGEFLRSWSTVRGIDVVDVREEADGVHAVVRMTLADGGHLRVEQLLTVADLPHRITGVQLLSAQRNQSSTVH